MKNNGPHFEEREMGVLGPVAIHGLDKGKMDLSRQKWSYKVRKYNHISYPFSCTPLISLYFPPSTGWSEWRNHEPGFSKLCFSS